MVKVSKKGKYNLDILFATVLWLSLTGAGFYLMETIPFINADLIGSGFAALGSVVPLLKYAHLEINSGNREDLKNMEIGMKQKESVASYTTVKELV